MPVVVTGADTPVGRALVPLLRQRGSEVRAVVQETGPADALRALGAKVAIDAVSDPDTLRAVLDEAHTVCHLVGNLFPPGQGSYEETILDATHSVLRAAIKAKATRFLLLSYPGASSVSENDFLRCLGLAEESVRESELQHAVIRSTHIYGPGSPWLELMTSAATRRPRVVVGDGSQRLAPVFTMDVARVLAAADDRAFPVSGSYGLEGPDVVTGDQLADLLGGRSGRKMHLRPDGNSTVRASLSIPFGAPLSRTILEVLARDSRADLADAAEEFGVPRTPLRAGLAASGRGVEQSPPEGGGPVRKHGPPDRP
jgi:uncharacterized protein YbjT (DUF2867 family)